MDNLRLVQTADGLGQRIGSINPVIAASAILRKYIGPHLDHYGRPFTLTAGTAKGYPDSLPSQRGMVLLDMGDELLDSRATLDALAQQMTVHTFAGGSHRFSNMEEALPLIEAHAKLR